MQAALVTFDHLAVAFLGCYGTTRIRTPHFDRFATGGVVFDQCYGTAEGSRPLSGLLELTEGLQRAGGSAVIHRCADAATGDAGAAAAIAGWRRAADGAGPALLWLQSPGIADPWTASPDRVFAAWQSAFPNHALSDALRECRFATGSSVDSETLLAAAWPQVLSQGLCARDRPAASLAAGRLRWCAYAAAVSTLDQWFGQVLAHLSEAATSESLVIVASAAGDLTGPHAELAAGCPPLIAPLVQTPLLIRTASSSVGTRRNGLVSVTDLAPTLAAWFDIDHAGGGHSLWPLLRDQSHVIRDELLIGSEAIGWSLRTREFACLARADELRDEFPDDVWLFVKPDDAWETLNVARQLPEITADYCRRMRAAASSGV